ncbi:peptidoglycan DD-metalloendopeptidase family protein [Paenibacillus sp. MBLB4367]|uniref:peptidoglycan DD-metalloendopeptidase family protein n=1 Tax=Paenibacillus sp. MBLB4367 TaxID=3384767 RepID=UPI00390834B3
MNVKWGKRTFTVMIIPDANRSVIRFRMPPFAVWAAAAVILCILFFAVVIYGKYANILLHNAKLQSELSGRALTYQQTVSDKDEAIEKLQNEVVELSQHADQMIKKVQEIEKFEDDLRTLSDIDAGSGKAVSAAETAPVGTGIGGTLIPVQDEEIARLSKDAKQTYHLLSERMNELQSSLTVIKQKVLEKQEQLRITPSIYPADIHTVSSGYGYRKDPFTFKLSFHSGIDFAAHAGDPAFVTADGVVVSTGSDNLHGNNVVVEHASGIRTWYMHLSKILVNQDDNVKKGQKIGLVGSTGRSTGPHLHYEVIVNGQTVDPRPYLNSTRKEE